MLAPPVALLARCSGSACLPPRRLSPRCLRVSPRGRAARPGPPPPPVFAWGWRWLGVGAGRRPTYATAAGPPRAAASRRCAASRGWVGARRAIPRRRQTTPPSPRAARTMTHMGLYLRSTSEVGLKWLSVVDEYTRMPGVETAYPNIRSSCHLPASPASDRATGRIPARFGRAENARPVHRAAPCTRIFHTAPTFLTSPPHSPHPPPRSARWCSARTLLFLPLFPQPSDRAGPLERENPGRARATGMGRTDGGPGEKERTPIPVPDDPAVRVIEECPRSVSPERPYVPDAGSSILVPLPHPNRPGYPHSRRAS